MNILAIIIKLIPTILALVIEAEEYFKDKPQSGAEKKAKVMEVIAALFSGADSVLTGGAAASWARLKPLIGLIIDLGATITFPHSGVINPTDPRNVA